METWSLPIIPKLPRYKMDCGGSVPFNLNPVVVLKDFRKHVTREPRKSADGEAMASLVKHEQEEEEEKYVGDEGETRPGEESGRVSRGYSPRMLTPPRSTPSPSLLARRDSGKKRQKSWDPAADYEIEKILGYHRDKNNKMWYLVKWKGWSKEHNTFEPIENMTGCNYILMKFFEAGRPSEADIKKKESEIDDSLKTMPIYAKLKKNRYRAEDLEEFSRECLDLGRLFNGKDIDAFEKYVRKEYKCIVRCLISMYYHQDPGLFLRGQNYRICLKLIKRRRKQLEDLSRWEERINNLEDALIKVENNVDLDHFPQIHYIVDMKMGKGVVVPKDPFMGCECVDGCNPRSHCCGKMGDSLFAYGQNGRLRLPERIPIYECNWRCQCPMSCPNRVVQHGRQVPLCIFKTTSCGWGVKALEKIPKGTFVCEYIGELILDSEAVVRDVEYYKEKESYIFDLDYCTDLQTDLYCIDSTKDGNVARFINHSCDPNLVVYPVWVDCLEPSLQRLAFFAKRNIRKGEEIHIDYENVQDFQEEEEEKQNAYKVRMISRVRCQCNASNCREWLFGTR